MTKTLYWEWIHYVNLHLVNLDLFILHFVNFTFGQPYIWAIYISLILHFVN